MKKVITPKQADWILSKATPQEIADASDVIGAVDQAGKGLMGDPTDHGWNATTVQLNTVPVAVVYWSKTTSEALYVPYLAAIGKGKEMGDLWKWISDVIDKIAKRENCKSISFHTRRAGMIAQASCVGYKPAGILMLKEL